MFVLEPDVAFKVTRRNEKKHVKEKKKNQAFRIIRLNINNCCGDG